MALYAALPIMAPIPAVTAIAKVPQKADSHRRPDDRGAAGPGAERAERDEKNQRGRGDNDHGRLSRREKRRQGRHCGAEREGNRRGKGGLNRFRRCALGQTKLVARMGGERVLGHELIGHLPRELRLHVPILIDMGELLPLLCRRLGERALFARKVRASELACELTDTYSPAAIDIAPAAQPAIAAVRISPRGRRRRDADDEACG